MPQEIEVFYNELSDFNAGLKNFIDSSYAGDLNGIFEAYYKISEKKQSLMNKYDKKDLKNFDNLFNSVVKQIRINVDNIIEMKRKELNVVSGNLITVNNKRKLVNYAR